MLEFVVLRAAIELEFMLNGLPCRKFALSRVLPVTVAIIIALCAKLNGAVYCNRSCLWVCLFVCLCVCVCYYDNSKLKLRASIFTKLGL